MSVGNVSDDFVKLCVGELLRRLLPDGGFALTDNGNYRPDSTAWAILALASVNKGGVIVDRARSRLKVDQEKPIELETAYTRLMCVHQSLLLIANSRAR